MKTSNDMQSYRTILLLIASLNFCSCGKPEVPNEGGEQSTAGESRFEATDALMARVAANLSDFESVATIDHSRLAGAEGVTMPPAVVTIYTVPAVNTALMKANPRVGLDLPLKILVFDGGAGASVSYPTSEFLAIRHGIADKQALARYDSGMAAGLREIDTELLAPVGADGVTRDYGIAELVSDFPSKETIARLKEAVMKQGDTVWFGEVDLSADASAEGQQIPSATLLLFGGPEPGGVAMAKFPKLGLDAFCQKILVYEDEKGDVRILFNDIVALAKLHYGTSEKPHEVINGRLFKTFEGAVKEKGA